MVHASAAVGSRCAQIGARPFGVRSSDFEQNRPVIKSVSCECARTLRRRQVIDFPKGKCSGGEVHSRWAGVGGRRTADGACGRAAGSRRRHWRHLSSGELSEARARVAGECRWPASTSKPISKPKGAPKQRPLGRERQRNGRRGRPLLCNGRRRRRFSFGDNCVVNERKSADGVVVRVCARRAALEKDERTSGHNNRRNR